LGPRHSWKHLARFNLALEPVKTKLESKHLAIPEQAAKLSKVLLRHFAYYGALPGLHHRTLLAQNAMQPELKRSCRARCMSPDQNSGHYYATEAVPPLRAATVHRFAADRRSKI
jgi:hypothetical protein